MPWNVMSRVGLGTAEYTKIFNLVKYIISLSYDGTEDELLALKEQVQKLVDRPSITLDYIKKNIPQFLKELEQDTSYSYDTPYTKYKNEPVANSRYGGETTKVLTLISPEKQNEVTKNLIAFARSHPITGYIVTEILKQTVENIDFQVEGLKLRIGYFTPDDIKKKKVTQNEIECLNNAKQLIQTTLSKLGTMKGGRRTRRFLRKRKQSRRRV